MDMSESSNRSLRVFLCHSSSDKPLVRELYQKLCAENWIKPWLDEEELYPGQDWNLEIEKAVEAADVILVCLSNNSVNKEGYVQRELRLVLDYADYKPEGTLYIIPVRLEECEPPRRLRPWQYADYFPKQVREKAFQRLLVSLKRRADALGLKYLPSKFQSGEPKGNEPAPDTSGGMPGSSSKEQDEALAWLEMLAAKQGVTEGLITHPDDRPKRPPAWVKEALSAANDSSKQIEARSELDKIILSNGMEFTRVPAGPFLMGSTKANDFAYENERPQHTVNLPYDYWIARFPVTNEHYNAYVKAKEIKHPVDGWKDRTDHPVIYVNWTDAVKYCQWLDNLFHAELPSDLVLRIPTEAEWEKAARGQRGNEWPWGNEFDQNKCNSGETNKQGTTPVGLYSPNGDSPYGCADMAGNVWEWTHSSIKNYPYAANDGREDEKTSNRCVLRGGSFYLDASYTRCACRFVNFGVLYRTFGFRVVLAPPIEEIIKSSKQ